MNNLGEFNYVELVQQDYTEKMLQQAEVCHGLIAKYSSKGWREHYEMIMYVYLFRWAGYRE